MKIKNSGLFAGVFGVFALMISAMAPVAANAQERDTKEFDKWMVVCEPQEDKTKSCGLTQSFYLQKKGEEKKAFLFAATINAGEKGQKFLFLRTPLGVNLNKGITLGIDDKTAITHSYRVCNALGCFAPVDLDDAMLKSMKAGTAMKASFLLNTGRTVNVEVTLKQFTAAYNYFEKEHGKK